MRTYQSLIISPSGIHPFVGRVDISKHFASVFLANARVGLTNAMSARVQSGSASVINKESKKA